VADITDDAQLAEAYVLQTALGQGHVLLVELDYEQLPTFFFML